MGEAQQDLIGSGRRSDGNRADIDHLVVDGVDLPQLHTHNAVLGLAHHQLDLVVAKLIGRCPWASDQTVG
jgi:hypothetical protein